VNEELLRALVRQTIARLDAQGGPASPPDPSALVHMPTHPSHFQYNLVQSDGPCLIEPGVQCNHCGYCLSHGH